jgi:hypothetical protein
MKYLVFCPCGHTLDRHASAGCDGAPRTPCDCRFDQRAALNAAIERVRCDPWDLLRERLATQASPTPRR